MVIGFLYSIRKSHPLYRLADGFFLYDSLTNYTILAVHHLVYTLLIYLRLAHLILRATSTRCNCKRPIRSSNFLRSSME